MISIAMRLITALVVAIFSLISYCGSKEYNPVTGEAQYISLTPRQEIALGVKSVPQMLRKYGGLYPKEKLQKYVDRVGFKVVNNSAARNAHWQFEFHLLNAPKTINAFALPGGQIFITSGLYRLLSGESQLAAVLAHEIGHVVARHSAQHMAKSRLTQGLADAVMVASGDAKAGQLAAVAGYLIGLKYSREDETEADRLGVYFMSDAGYDPRGMIQLMEILNNLSSSTRMPEFFSTHPNPKNRIGKIRMAIQEKFPGGFSKGSGNSQK